MSDFFIPNNKKQSLHLGIFISIPGVSTTLLICGVAWNSFGLTPPPVENSEVSSGELQVHNVPCVSELELQKCRHALGKIKFLLVTDGAHSHHTIVCRRVMWGCDPILFSSPGWTRTEVAWYRIQSFNRLYLMVSIWGLFISAPCLHTISLPSFCLLLFHLLSSILLYCQWFTSPFDLLLCPVYSH